MQKSCQISFPVHASPPSPRGEGGNLVAQKPALLFKVWECPHSQLSWHTGLVVRSLIIALKIM